MQWIYGCLSTRLGVVIRNDLGDSNVKGFKRPHRTCLEGGTQASAIKETKKSAKCGRRCRRRLVVKFAAYKPPPNDIPPPTAFPNHPSPRSRPSLSLKYSCRHCSHLHHLCVLCPGAYPILPSSSPPLHRELWTT